MTHQLYAHFHPDEHRFVDKANEWVERAAFQHTVKQTDFLDPRQAFIVQSLANRHGGTTLRFDGGYPGAERKRAILAPDYRTLDDEPSSVNLLAITSDDARIRDLDHGDYLGAMLGVGIKRDKIGDLHVQEQQCHCLLTDDIVDYVRLHLQQVHRIRVYADILPLDQLQVVSQTLEELDFTVASMRLDGIVSDVYRISRSKVLAPIQAGRCKVNWKPEEDPSKPLKEGDVVSFQGFGRFKVLAVTGETKKGRIRLKVGKFV